MATLEKEECSGIVGCVMKNVLSFFWEVGAIALIALVLVVGFRIFVFQPFLVRGESMEPNFHNWDYLVVDEISYRFREPKRGEVIVFKYPNDPSQRYIKRIIGLPGETVEVENREVAVIKGAEKIVLSEEGYLHEFGDNSIATSVTLGQDEFFVMGDNRARSSDSRVWGALDRELIIGRVFIRVFPVSAFAKVPIPAYKPL